MRVETVDTSHPPFALPAPLVHVLNLPCPPSVNRIWAPKIGAGRGTVRVSPAYKAWVVHADARMLMSGGLRGLKTIYGPFRALLELKRPDANSDLDNRIKCVLDYAQRLKFIDNDKRCEEIIARWSTVHECRLTLTELA